MRDNVNVFNIFKMIVEIKSNPRQSDRDIYTSLGFSRAAFYKYRKYLAEKTEFRFRYSRKDARFVVENDPFLPGMNLTLGELSSLVLAMGQIFASGGDYIVSYRALKAVQKLLAHCPDRKIRDSLSLLLADGLENRGYGCREEILNKVEEARENQQILKIRYYSASSRCEKDYLVEPYTVYFKRRALYMDAYSRDHEEVRQFRLGRIRDAQILSHTGFEVPKTYSFRALHENAFSVFGGAETKKVRIRFSARVAEMIREVLWHRSQKISEDPSGGILFEVDVAHPPEVVWWMRQWGPDAEILEPPEMRELAREMARKEMDLYGDSNRGE